MKDLRSELMANHVDLVEGEPTELAQHLIDQVSGADGWIDAWLVSWGLKLPN